MFIPKPKSAQPLPEHAKKVFNGVVFDVYQWEQELFDGTTAVYEKIKRPDTAAVFPVLPDGRILLFDQIQAGTTSYISAPGGRVDEGEDVLAAAKRELLEETGYEADTWVLWKVVQPVMKIDWTVYNFIAKGLRKVSDLSLDAGERVTQRIVTFDEFLDLAAHEDFTEKEIIPILFQAKYEPEKKEELKKLFSLQ